MIVCSRPLAVAVEDGSTCSAPSTTRGPARQRRRDATATAGSRSARSRAAQVYVLDRTPRATPCRALRAHAARDRGRRPRHAPDRHPAARRRVRTRRGELRFAPGGDLTRPARRALERRRRPRRLGAPRRRRPRALATLSGRAGPGLVGARCRTAGDVLLSARARLGVPRLGRRAPRRRRLPRLAARRDSLGALLWCGTGPGARRASSGRCATSPEMLDHFGGFVTSREAAEISIAMLCGRCPASHPARVDDTRRTSTVACGGSDSAHLRANVLYPPPGHRRGAPGPRSANRLGRSRRARARRGVTPARYARATEAAPAAGTSSFFVPARSRRAQRRSRRSTSTTAPARVTEAWTGFQVAWTMARGYPGAFGRRSTRRGSGSRSRRCSSLPFLRRPLRLLHLDLLGLLAFSVSFAFFNEARSASRCRSRLRRWSTCSGACCGRRRAGADARRCGPLLPDPGSWLLRRRRSCSASASA